MLGDVRGELEDGEDARGIEAVERDDFEKDVAGLGICGIGGKEIGQGLFGYVVFAVEPVACVEDELLIRNSQGSFHRYLPRIRCLRRV